MNILIIMIPLSLFILIGAIAAFFWAVNNDQFDDMDSPGMLPMTDKNIRNEKTSTNEHLDANDGITTSDEKDEEIN